MEDFLFWVIWSATTILCLSLVWEGLKHTEKILEWPFMVGSICLYLFSFMGLYAHFYLSETIGSGVASLGLLVVFTCILCIKLGWTLGLRKWSPYKSHSYSHVLVWSIGTTLVILSTIISYLFREALNTKFGSVTWENTSAYWYLFFYVGYPGLGLSLWALQKMSAAEKKMLFTISMIAFALFIFPHVYTARRGPLFPGVVTLLFVPLLSSGKKPNRFLTMTALLLTGFTMLAFVEARKFIYNTGTWSNVFDELIFADIVEAKARSVPDNEFVNNCFFISTLYSNGKYQFGTGHMELLVHWVPRSFWPDKPSLGEGFYPHAELLSDVDQYSGLSILGSGAAAGGFADSFVQYGILTPLFWFLVSLYFGRCYSSVRQNDDPLPIFLYMALPCSTLWLLTQGFAAAFVPGAIFMAVPYVVLRFARQ